MLKCVTLSSLNPGGPGSGGQEPERNSCGSFGVNVLSFLCEKDTSLGDSEGHIGSRPSEEELSG